MSFSHEEKQKAQGATYNIGSYIHGNIQNSQVGTASSIQHNVSQGIDFGVLQQVIATLKRDGGQLNLAEEKARELTAELQTLEAQANSPKPKEPIIRMGLTSVRAILEGAVGNALAAGVVYEISKLMG